MERPARFEAIGSSFARDLSAAAAISEIGVRGNENVRLYLGTFRKHIQDRVALNPKSTYLQYTVLSVDFYRQYLCRHSGKEYRKAHPLNRGTHSAASRDMKPKVDIATVDLFCGVGGLSLGLQKAGFRIRVANQFTNETSAPRSYSETLHFLSPPICEHSMAMRKSAR